MKKEHVHKCFISYREWVENQIAEADPNDDFDCICCDGYGELHWESDFPEKCYDCHGTGILAFKYLDTWEQTQMFTRTDYDRDVRGWLWKLYDWQGWEHDYSDSPEIEEIISKIK